MFYLIGKGIFDIKTIFMRSLLAFIAVVSVFSMCSCNEMDVDGKTRVIQDSLVNIFPSWQALKIKVGDNNTSMLIVMGDASFYKATDDEKAKKAAALGQMVLRIFGKGNYLEKGKLVVTGDIRNNSETPPDGISIPIDFSALKKTVGQ